MKSTLIFSFLTALSFTFLGSISPESNKVILKKDSTVYRVGQISKMTIQIDSLDKDYFGLCDTCVASFRGAIVKNRMLAKRISEQNFEMEKLIEKNDSTIAASKK